MAEPILRGPNDVTPQQKGPMFEKEIKIKVNSKKIGHALFITFILISIFLLGRASAGGDFGLTGFATSVESLFEEDATVEEPVVEPEIKEEVKEETKPVEQEAAPPKDSEPAVEEEDVITKDYGAVTLTLKGIDKEWYDGWGEIKKVNIEIKNKESGTIKPDELIMNVAGYDYDKKINFPEDLKSIKSGKGYAVNLIIPYGFTYSKDEIKDLSDVKITLSFLDNRGATITTATKGFSLQG